MKKCEFCDAEFEPGLIKGTPIYWQRYCSPACGVNARNHRRRERVKKALQAMEEKHATAQ